MNKMKKIEIINQSNTSEEPEIEILYNGENVLDFWMYDEKGNPKILQSKLMRFLGRKGFVNITQDGINIGLVQEIDNRIRKSSPEIATQIIRKYLERKGVQDVYEVFAKGVGNYLSKMKFNLLNSIELINDRDSIDSSRLYFQNVYVHITANGIEAKPYNELEGVIWENRIVNREFLYPGNKIEGQFESFCLNICKNDYIRFKAFKTMLGYLLHRNTDKGEDVAVILYDENMGGTDRAEGGTGKSLISSALNHCRERVQISGKHLKTSSYFVYQRVNLTTDIIVFDDLDKSASLEIFFDMITGGIEVEKKRQQAFYIPRHMMPKIMFTSNYLIKGPKGSSNERRRYEFELANYYSNTFRPEDEFGNRFFDNSWPDDEWNSFYYFLMSCIQDYLKNGLIIADPINLDKGKKQSYSCNEFIEFAEIILERNKWQDKREFRQLFEEYYPNRAGISSHLFTKWLKDYAIEIGCNYEDKSTGGDYIFIIRDKEVENE
jgi:hypothetical protein